MSMQKRFQQIETLPCRAKLPAAVWRSLAASERPRDNPGTIVGVRVEDAAETVIVMSWMQYNRLIQHLRDLEVAVNGEEGEQ